AGGGPSCCGIAFKLTPGGGLTILHAFSGSPSSLIQGLDGNFYGTTWDTLFTMTPSGTVDALHTFDFGTEARSIFGPSGLVQGPDGNLYGTNLSDGTGGQGT